MEEPHSSFSAAASAPLSSIATAMLFGSITFTTAALSTRTWITGDTQPMTVASTIPQSRPLDTTSFLSTYALLYHSTVFGGILFFAYMCEHHPLFPHSEKVYDRDEFFFVTAIVLLVSAYTVHRNDAPKVGTISGNGGGNGKGVHAGTGSSSSKGLSLENKLQTISEGGAKRNKTSNGNDINGKNANGNSNSNSNINNTSNNASIADDSTYSSYTTSYTTTTIHTQQTFLHAAPTKTCNDVLNRDQTEEWKGWMQFVFLLYHYYHAEEVYNSIRVMITCYVWMTGFGNFSFFYLKNDYRFVRVVQMLWRLNFLVLFLCMSQGSTYMLYYICPLHTYFFLMVYGTMGIGRHLNYSKYGLRVKMAVLALIIYLLWDVDTGLFRMLHFWCLGTTPQLGATNGNLWEWYFRSSLDHWSTFLGMVFAANYPITSLFFRKLEAEALSKKNKVQCWLGKGAVGAGLLCVTTLWVLGPFRQVKFVYNATNAYFGTIPLLTYIYFRNLTPTLRSYSLRLLHEIGKTTLETYLMQHHIWLTSNAKSLLVLVPGMPKVNMLVVTVIYFYISRRLYKLTLYLRGMLLPDDKKRCIISLVYMGCAVAFFYVLALVLDNFGLTSLTTVAIVSSVCGMLLYQTVMDFTWEAYQKKSSNSAASRGGGGGGDRGENGSGGDDSSYMINSVLKNDRQKLQDVNSVNADSSVARLSPPIIGIMVILIVGISWQGLAIAGAGKIAPLHSGCGSLANNGHWIHIDGCNEQATGAARRNFGISNFATCGQNSGAYTWGWETSPSSTHCRFIQRDEKGLLKSLRDKRIAFVGDSMTRNLYHAFCRQLGIQDAGQFDATGPKHQDIARTAQKTGVEFKWAPLASEQLEAVRDIRTKLKQQDVSKFDLVVMGGGAWDRLHLYATDENKDSLQQTLADLKEEMSSLQKIGSPVVWVTPTTINTRALNTAEKRDHMTEEDMADMRSVYEKSGILSSSSFVIDGPAFSKERVDECYDGVHYPNDVYSAGAQILANALDWLLPKTDKSSEPFTAPEPGKMANPFLGLMMLCLSFIGLFFFDGFLGFSYLAGIFVKGVLPSDLYLEAFTVLHEKMKLPPITFSSSASVATMNTFFSASTNRTKNTVPYSKQSNVGSSVRRRSPGRDTSVDDEIAALLGGHTETEMKNMK